MPLQSGSSKETISKNIAELINAGHPEKQAAAIAYSEARKTSKDVDSHREFDLNGWPEIKDNPISKVGVFPYFGHQIDDALEPDKIYYVYRPEEELSNPECIESFKLIPWIEDHVMLGDGEGKMLPERKGIEGVTGENVRYDNGYLKANLKVFSKKMWDKIDQNKKIELSIGYTCSYDLQSGVYNGEKYDAIQRNLRGNHLALVDKGRAGPDVSVLDHFKFTFDGELIMPDEKKDDVTMDSAAINERFAKIEDSIKTIADKMDAIVNSKDEEAKKEEMDNEEENEKKETADSQIKRLTADIEALKKKSAADANDAQKMAFDRKAFFAEISQRDALAQKLSRHIGTFDHSDKTLQEVAEYGVQKLKLKAPKGNEIAVLDGYFVGMKHSVVPMQQLAQDEQDAGDDMLNDYLKGE